MRMRYYGIHGTAWNGSSIRPLCEYIFHKMKATFVLPSSSSFIHMTLREDIVCRASPTKRREKVVPERPISLNNGMEDGFLADRQAAAVYSLSFSLSHVVIMYGASTLPLTLTSRCRLQKCPRLYLYQIHTILYSSSHSSRLM